MMLLVVYLTGAVIMAAIVFRATDGGAALVGSSVEVLGACLLWVLAWPVFAAILGAVAVANALARWSR